MLVSSLAVTPGAGAGAPGAISGLSAHSGAAGELTVTWHVPEPVPDDYRLMWAPATGDYRTWTDLSGNAFPTDNQHTITGLSEGETYKLKVRARYRSGPWSGPWSAEIRAAVTTAEPLTPTTTTTTTAPPTPTTTLPATADDQTAAKTGTKQAIEGRATIGNGRGSVGGVRLTSETPGTLSVTWNRSNPAPNDYEFVWARRGQSGTDQTMYPTTEQVTLTGLVQGAVYEVQIRSRYSNWKGEWSFTYTKRVAEPEPEPEPEPYDGVLE
ncbi:MAG: fibronectin type III domain-containing protein, partial [Chloroflexi bacterium]|nr:fibronectin type III domain-containing protein [Chloroflexota bacterium]